MEGWNRRSIGNGGNARQQQDDDDTLRRVVRGVGIGLGVAAGAYCLYKWCSPAVDPYVQSVLDSFRKKVQDIEEEPPSAVGQDAVGQIYLESQSASPKYREEYNKFDPWLMKLHSKIIKIDGADRRHFLQATAEVFKKLIDSMCEGDPLFKILFQTMSPAGSAWENLKICHYDEFDINMILKFYQTRLETVDLEPNQPGHIAIRVKDGFSSSVFERELRKHHPDFSNEKIKSIICNLNSWLDDDKCLNRCKVQYWMQGVAQKALNSLKSESWTYVEEIATLSNSGPAVTISIWTKGQYKFSIDLVPAIEFPKDDLPFKTAQKAKQMNVTRPRWYAIPKGPYPHSKPVMWRTSLYEMERDLMKGSEFMKPTIRCLKRLRDFKKWGPLSSYYIKTVFMWKHEERTIWNQGLGVLMMESLDVLMKTLNKHEIPYYWDDDLNLLKSSVKQEFSQNTANSLCAIIAEFKKSLKDDSINPMRHFGCDKEGNLLSRESSTDYAFG